MNRSKYFGLIVLFALIISMVFYTGQAHAADRMTFEDYQIELQRYQDREAKALEIIEAEKAIIDSLRTRIAEIEAQTTATWDELYAFIGVTEDDIKAFLAAIAQLEGRVSEFGRLPADRRLERASELDDFADEIKVMQQNPITLLSDPRNRLNRLAARVEALKSSLPKPKHDMYHVIRGDYLWRISGKQDIFNDPWKWMRIYSANRDEIKDPDLIYPAQVFRIPRQVGRDEHLVAKGEFLRMIAGYAQVYGDPFQWTKIFQANKKLIQDPNLIYPEQILSVPRN